MAYYYQEKYTCLDCKETGTAKTCSFCKSKNTQEQFRNKNKTATKKRPS